MSIPLISPVFLPEDHPDLLENTDLPAKVIRKLRDACFTRLSDFDNLSDIDLLREPGIGLRDVRIAGTLALGKNSAMVTTLLTSLIFVHRSPRSNQFPHFQDGGRPRAGNRNCIGNDRTAIFSLADFPRVVSCKGPGQGQKATCATAFAASW
ncbi:hypothetical protein [Rhizobium sp. Nf11,1]|uniref:hypothetical protein n=1 Tax=unclassified Rhizobium TaxID=2613769 RepID=UPI003D34A18C